MDAIFRLVLLTTLALGIGACPFGWHFSGRSCYQISRNTATYDQAAAACGRFSSCSSGFSGHLVSVTTDFENTQIMDILAFNNMQRNETWLGLRATRPLLWESGEPHNTRMTNPWQPGSPTPGINSCTVAINGRWATRSCNMPRYYICEMGGEAPPPAMLQNLEDVASP